MMSLQWFPDFLYVPDQQAQNYTSLMRPPQEDPFDLNQPLEYYLWPTQEQTSPSYSGESEFGESEMYELEKMMNLTDEQIREIINVPDCIDDENQNDVSLPPTAINLNLSEDVEEGNEAVVPNLCPVGPREDVITAGEENQEQTEIVVKPDQKPVKKRTRKRKAKMRKTRGPKQGPNRSIHLWEFLQELLNSGTSNYIQWISKKDGVFRLVNSSAVAKLWGQRKNRQNMTYEKMSRALRYYYEKQILERVPNARLIYKFGVRTKSEVSEADEEPL